LIQQHNEMVSQLWDDNGDSNNRLPSVGLRSLHAVHLVTLSPQTLVPIIFAHIDRTVHSLSHGRGTKIEYDHRGIDEELHHRFVSGRPRVLLDDGLLTRWHSRSEVHQGHVTDGLRAMVPQTELPPALVEAILAELGSSSSGALLSRALRTLEIAVGFLHTSPYDGEMPMQLFLTDVLVLDGDGLSAVSEIAAKNVQLQHTLSLLHALKHAASEEDLASGRDPFPDHGAVGPASDFKCPIAPERESAICAVLAGINTQQLGIALRLFILERLTKANLDARTEVGTDWRPWPVVVVAEGLGELEEWHGLLEELEITVGEVVTFWCLLYHHHCDDSLRTYGATADVGSIASRATHDAS